MQISVASYLKGIPSKNVNPQKTAIIMNFIKGVNTLGDIGNVITNYDIANVDVAVVQGFVHPNSRNSSHLTLRKNVFESQQQRGKRSIVIYFYMQILLTQKHSCVIVMTEYFLTLASIAMILLIQSVGTFLVAP